MVFFACAIRECQKWRRETATADLVIIFVWLCCLHKMIMFEIDFDFDCYHHDKWLWNLELCRDVQCGWATCNTTTAVSRTNHIHFAWIRDVHTHIHLLLIVNIICNRQTSGRIGWPIYASRGIEGEFIPLKERICNISNHAGAFLHSHMHTYTQYNYTTGIYERTAQAWMCLAPPNGKKWISLSSLTRRNELAILYFGSIYPSSKSALMFLWVQVIYNFIIIT